MKRPFLRYLLIGGLLSLGVIAAAIAQSVDIELPRPLPTNLGGTGTTANIKSIDYGLILGSAP